MPRAKSLSHYPARYGELVEACAVRSEQIDVKVDSLEQARSLRGHYYAYKGALMRTAQEITARRNAAGGIFPLTKGEADIVEKAKQAETVIVTILAIDGQSILRFENRENSWQAKALAGATSVDSGGKPTSGELDAIAARLAQIKPETPK